ncbi:MAG: transglycosylase SLT domain-containing protein [Kibdelosporangium sp.]
MSKLSAEEIARYARDAGFSGQGLTIAVAVALAESAGDPRAHNSDPPDDSYGLWQINMLGALGPERRRQHDLRSNDELFDPAVNAKAANVISGDGKSWTPWSTYTNGAYKKFLGKARRAVESRGAGKDVRHDGYQVDPDLLLGYVQRTRNVADKLTSAGSKYLRPIDAGSFGKIGKESGFTDALDRFGSALTRQVKHVASRADTLAASTSRAAHAYQDQERGTAKRLDRRDV